jgi:hypothetical protein
MTTPTRQCDFRIQGEQHRRCRRLVYGATRPELPAACWQHERMYSYGDLVVSAVLRRNKKDHS